jgi:hypothetical protein
MYLVNSRFLKSSKFSNDHLEIQIWRESLIWGSPHDVTTYINNVLPHLMIQQIDVSNVLPQINKKT